MRWGAWQGGYTYQVLCQLDERFPFIVGLGKIGPALAAC